MSVRKGPRVHSDYTKLLASIFGFMRKSGFQKNEVIRICGQELERMNDAKAAASPSRATLAADASTLDAWYRNRRYLDGTQPRAIPLLGPSPSVEALIRSQDGAENPA